MNQRAPVAPDSTTAHPEDASPLLVLLAGIERARKHTLWSLLTLIVGTGVGWVYSDRLYQILALPVTRELEIRGQDPRLVFTGLTDPFILYFSVSLFTGVVLASPLLLAQLFIIVGHRIQRRRVLAMLGFVVSATTLFLSGIAFCYFVLLPFAVAYLLEVGSGFEHAITVRDFLTFAVRLMLALGIAAQLPLVSFTAARVGLVNARTLLRWFPYAVLAIFVAAAWLTPPDVLSQVLVAVPLLGLYLLGVAVAALAGR